MKITVLANVLLIVAIIMGMIVMVFANDFLFLKFVTILLFLISGLLYMVELKRK